MPGESYGAMSAKDFVSAVKDGVVTDSNGQPVNEHNPATSQAKEVAQQKQREYIGDWRSMLGLLLR